MHNKQDWRETLAKVETRPSGNRTFTPIRNQKPPSEYAAMVAKADEETVKMVKEVIDRWEAGLLSSSEAIRQLQDLNI